MPRSGGAEHSPEDGGPEDLRALPQNEARYRALLDHSPVCHNIVDLDFNLQYMNAKGFRMLKLDEACYGKPYPFEFFPEAARQVLAAGLLTVRDTAKTVALDTLATDAEGSPVWLHHNLIPILEPGGTVEWISVVSADITERKRAAEAIAQSEALLEDAGRMARVGGWELDARTRDVTWTRETYRLHEVPFDQRPPLEKAIEFFHPEDRPRLEEGLRRALLYGEPYDLELRFTSAKGRELITRTLCVPVVENGEVVRLRGTFQDITEQREMQERLRQMEKMDAIGHLAGGVAHDFNNQLTGIMGYADMLRARLEDGDLQRYVENILVAARRSSDLTQKLLAFARKGQYESVPVDMHAVLREVVEFLHHSLDKRIEIKQVLSARPATTRGDPGQLQNAILNLAINAGDAMPEGGELILETAIAELEKAYCESLPYDIVPGPYLRVCVTDTGGGIAPEDLAHIFEPFFTTKEVGKGTGMGLAAVYGTVKQHAGAITVYSEVGHGTTFRVYLPLEDEAARQALQSSEAVPAFRPARVLVVDDEEVVRTLAAEMLSSFGYTVTVAENGEAALAFYEKRWSEFDLVLLDMVMPKKNGPETYRAMKAINPEVKVLLASGYSLNGAAQGLLAEGVQGFIQKPFARAALSAKVAEALQPKEGPQKGHPLFG